MAKPAAHTRLSSKQSAGTRKTGKIHVTQASASEIRKTLGITPAEMKVAAKAIAATQKTTASLARVTVTQKPKAARASTAKRANAS